MIRSAIFALTIALLAPLAEGAAEKKFIKPGERDKCPVCGMFVAKYPDWTAEIVFADGSYAAFDGPKDLFKHYFDLKKSAASQKRVDEAAIFVMDYYRVQPIDGRAAWYVAGSDIYGPMGRELIPFEREADAREFMKDHGGTQILRFTGITPEVMKGLE
jgi:nitrous oxide reductase accessory protein NosL